MTLIARIEGRRGVRLTKRLARPPEYSVGMIEIDGSEGGGQMLRSALSLAVLTEERVRIDNVRANRPNPGLRPQHIAAIRVLSRMTSGFVSGGYVESPEVVFQPRSSPWGSTVLDVGTAGSLPLLFETLVPLGPVVESTLEVTATGGTAVKWSPTMDYFTQIKLPLLRRYGVDAEVEVHGHGFYPEGGGEATIRVEPTSVDRIDLTERGDLERVTVRSLASDDLADARVAERQVEGVIENVPADVEVDTTDIVYVEAPSTGTCVLVAARYGHTLAGFDAVGERGVPAEEIGGRAAGAFHSFHDGVGAVDRHLGDQLMLPLALGGGTVAVPTVTEHMRTNLSVIEAFGGDVSIVEPADGPPRLVAEGTL